MWVFTVNQESPKTFGCHVDGTRFLGMSYWIISYINGSSQKTCSFFVYYFFVCFGWGVRSGYSCSSYRGTISFAFSSPLRVPRPWSFDGHSNCFKYILGGKSKACPSNKLTFPCYPKPLFQSEAKCKAIDMKARENELILSCMKMILYSHANKTHFPRKVLQLACFERESLWNTEMSHCIQLFRERLSDKVHATTPKCIAGGLEFTVFQRNLKQWHERPWTYVCEC